MVRIDNFPRSTQEEDKNENLSFTRRRNGMNSQPVRQVRENIDEGEEEMADYKMVKKKTVLHRYFTLSLSNLKATAYHKLQPFDKSLTLKF